MLLEDEQAGHACFGLDTNAKPREVDEPTVERRVCECQCCKASDTSGSRQSKSDRGTVLFAVPWSTSP